MVRKSISRQHLLCTSILVGLTTAYAPSHHANAADIVVNTDTTTAQTLSTADTLTVTETGSISNVVSGVIIGNNVDATSIDNAGTISGTTNGILITDGSPGLVSLTNTGTISGGVNGINHISTTDSSITSISNSGTIIGTSGSGISLQGSSTSVISSVSNTGTITGTTGITITGTGQLEVTTLTNSGTITGTGGTAISLESLTSAITVNLNGGTISGDIIDDNHTSGLSTVNIGGNFTTGGDVTVSDLTVSAGNNFTIRAGDTVDLNTMSASAGTITFDVESSSSAGMLDVTGAGADVDLTGATVAVNVSSNSNLSDGDEIRVADGNAAITGGPGGTKTSVTDNSYLWGFQMADGTAAATPTDNTELYLFVTEERTLESVASNQGNAQAGNALREITGDPQANIVLAQLNSASSASEVNQVLEAIQPDTNTGNIKSALEISAQNVMVNTNRLSNLRSAQSRSLGISAGDEMESNERAWLQGFGSNSEQSVRDGVAGYSANTRGFAFGMDTDYFHEDIVLGAAFSIANASISSDSASAQRSDINTYQLSFYGDYDINENTYVEGVISYGVNRVKTSRSPAANITAIGKYDAQQVGGYVELGKDYDYAYDITFSPNVSLNYSAYIPDTYTETGAGGLNATVNGDTVQLLEIGTGAEIKQRYEYTSGAALEPSIRLGIRYDTIGDRIENTSQFVGGSTSFRTVGADPAQLSMDFGASLHYFSTEYWEFLIDYDYTHKEDYHSHAGIFKATFNF